MGQIGRRTFLVSGAALLLAPRAARAQPADKMHRIGFVVSTSPGARRDAFLGGLRDLGYIEGRNIHIETRFAEGRPDRFPGLIQEVIRLRIDVLVVGSTIGARAARQATTTIPIVFAGSSDPVAAGLVATLARPGGNITGFSLAYGDGFAGKWLELLQQAVPDIAHVAALWSSSNAAAAGFVREIQAAARVLDVRLDMHHAATPPELDGALTAIGGSGARGLIVMPSPFAATRQGRLIEFAASKRLPAMYFAEDFADAGGLMSYGPSIVEAYRRAATHVDKILKGARPGDIPVEQPTRFELTINLRTAHALGLRIPESVLLRAGRTLE
ncbi:MAG: hypothetical protein A2X52_00230 [Candidatus Rokubacteria bacterium GWC2_70_16]|nr:MAG: hypothetical protein A2X52_00230 [Candidatus Rokubacteria bacterium GWC2_70_16]OGL20223.1 MAG: hypothetical protein A3K12_01630 [Candidatus Rokubacteria bacterium RIFCSPLOWO2_12_FULL_71_19]